MARNLWRPVLFSSIHWRANSPDWISERIFFISARIVGVDDARAARVIAIFGGVGDGVAHVAETAFLDEIDDQLEFVEALEIGDFGRVSGFHQRFETGADQLCGAAAQARPARRTDRFRSPP